MNGFRTVVTPGMEGNSNLDMASSREPILPPCRVCGNKASGLHYGVNTCEGCKGFFRRTLAKGSKYLCQGNGTGCPVFSKNRNTCKACRYKKCIELGMSKTAIKTGRYTHTKRTEYITEIKRLETLGRWNVWTEDCQVSSSTVELSHTPSHGHFDGGNQSDYWSVTDNHGRLTFGSNIISANAGKLNLSDKSVSNESGSNTLKFCDSKMKVDNPIPMDPENAELLETLMRLQSEFVEDLDSFLDEEKMSQAQMKYSKTLDGGPGKASVPTQDENKCGTTSEANEEGYKMTEQLAALINTELKRLVQFVKSIPGWKDLNMEDQVSLIKESQVEVWLLGHYLCMNENLGVFTGEFTTSIEETRAEQLYDDKYLALLYRTAESFKSLHLSKEEVAILRVIVLTFTDRVPLKDSEKVEKIHWRLIECLKSYYSSLGVTFNRRFAHIIDRLTAARDLTDSFNNLTLNMIRCWPVIKKYPLLAEFYSA